MSHGLSTGHRGCDFCSSVPDSFLLIIYVVKNLMVIVIVLTVMFQCSDAPRSKCSVHEFFMSPPPPPHCFIVCKIIVFFTVFCSSISAV